MNCQQKAHEMLLLKKIILIFLLLLVPVVLYFSVAKLLTFFPTKPKVTTEKTHTIYISYGDIHTDIVVALKDLNGSWFEKVHPIQNKKEGYLSIGWGDKASYLHPRTYDTIPLKVMFQALFINTPSLLHTHYYPSLRYHAFKSVSLCETQLQHLLRSLFHDFDFDAKAYKGYGQHSHLYSSSKSYNFINTCNTYTGDKLREANISMSYWTPLRENVMDVLP